jgi:hypothetical protein
MIDMGKLEMRRDKLNDYGYTNFVTAEVKRNCRWINIPALCRLAGKIIVGAVDESGHIHPQLDDGSFSGYVFSTIDLQNIQTIQPEQNKTIGEDD